jgi:hypothetical protein
MGGQPLPPLPVNISYDTAMNRRQLDALRAQSAALSSQLAEGRRQLLAQMAQPYEAISGQQLSTHYNGELQRWQLHASADQMPDMVLDLETNDPEDYLGAEAESFTFIVSTLMPVIEPGQEGEVPAVVFDGEWQLWLPCRLEDGCGGFHLRLDLPHFDLASFMAILSPADQQATMQLECCKARALGERMRRLLDQASECMGCVSTMIRHHGVNTDQAFLWFDCLSQDWQLWQPMGEGGVSLPLGVGGFNRNPAEIINAARALDPKFQAPGWQR